MKRLLKINIIIITVVFFQAGYSYAGTQIAERERLLRETERIVRGNEQVPEEIDAYQSLDDYLRLGLRYNSALKAAFYEWQAAFAKIPQVFSLPDPQLRIPNMWKEVETRVGPQEKAFSIQQKFPLPDKLWIRKSKAFKASEVAYHNLEKKRLRLIYQITDAYYEYAYLNKAIILTEENIKLLKNFESVAQARYKAALTKNQDLLKVQVELGKLENEFNSLKDLRGPLVSRLNALLHLPADTILPWPDETLEDIVMQDRYGDIEALYDFLRENNPEIMALSENVKKHKDGLKLAKREFFPDLAVGVTHISTGEALNPSVVDNGKDSLMVMFSVNLPIWFERLHAGVEEARASLNAAQHTLNDKENEVESRLALVHYKVRDAVRQSYLYKDALLPKAAQTLNATKSGYEAGSIDFLSLIDAQRVLLNFQLAYYRHNASFYQRLSELRSLLGEIQVDQGGEGEER